MISMWHDRFAAKKMKRLMVISYTILACTICSYGQKYYVGTDLAGALCFGTIQLNIAHAFAPRWTAGAEIGLNISTKVNYYNELEKEHMEALGQDYGIWAQTTEQISSFQNICAYFCYWPIEAYHGPSIRLGCQTKDTKIPDLMLGIGYSFTFLKGIGTEIIYQCGIKDTYENGKSGINCLKAGLFYVF